jgi:hypothetical protein
METGYELTLGDFRQLLAYPAYRIEVAPLILDWFGYEVVPTDDGFTLHDVSGVEVSPKLVHEMIQADHARQFRIYQVAMSLWR